MSEEPMTQEQPIFTGKHGRVYRHGEHFATEGAGHLLCTEMAAEIERLRRYREHMETAHGARLYAIDNLLEHFDADGNLKGDGKWRLKEIFRYCQAIDESSQRAGELFNNDPSYDCDLPCAWCGRTIDKHGEPGESEHAKAAGKLWWRLCPGTTSQFYTPHEVPHDEVAELADWRRLNQFGYADAEDVLRELRERGAL